MSGVFVGPEGGGVFVGPGDDGGVFVGSDDTGVLVGSDDTAVLVGPPVGAAPILMAEFRDQTTPHSRAEHDGMAPTAYAETSHRWWVSISRYVTDPSLSAQLLFIGSSASSINPRVHWLVRATNGFLRAIIGNFSSTIRDFTSSLNAGDGAWHVNQLLDEGSGVGPYQGTLRLKMDGIARQSTAAYTRFSPDATYPKWATMSHVRYGPLGSPQTPEGADYDSLYLAQITGCAPSDVQMTSVSDAFHTGGGKEDLQAVTDAIAAVVLAAGGTLEWAGPLDGSPTRSRPLSWRRAAPWSGQARWTVRACHTSTLSGRATRLTPT
jgi:hypothetical protein